MILAAVPFLFGCEKTQPHKNDAEGIDPSAALELREDYLKQLRLEYQNMEITLADVWVQEYYGTYSGCEVVYMGDPFDVTMGQVNMVVAGYIITFRDGKTLYVHKDSHFYTVQEAYEAGYITKEDIEDFGPKVCVKFKEWEGEVVTSDGSLIVTIPPA